MSGVDWLTTQPNDWLELGGKTPLPMWQMRAAARHPETGVHAAADANYKQMMLVVSAAFMRGRKVLKNSLNLRAAGDFEGHPFHGNQWTSGAAGNLLKDENGDPLVVFHGTDRSFDRFDTSHGGDTLTTNTGAANGVLGTFFTTDNVKAEDLYAGKRGRVVEANLALKNPLKLRGREFEGDASAAVNKAAAEYHDKDTSTLTEQDFRDWKDFLVRQGHDGIEVTLAPFRGKSEKDYVVFSPEQIKTLGDFEGHPFRGNQWVNADHQTAAAMTKVTPTDAPLKTYTAYHVTRRENVESILKSGFNVAKVKPRWVNDKAVSLSATTAEKAANYFSKNDPKTGKPIGLDTSKYALLEVHVQGRLHKAGEMGSGPIGYASSPDNYRQQMIAKGYDGQHLGRTIYVHNEKAIKSIREIEVPKPRIRTAGDVPGHPFHGNQWTTGDVSSMFSGDTMVHGSPQHLSELQPGSMFSNDPAWAAGYTTHIGADNVETFTGSVHSLEIPKGPTVDVRGVHNAESKLLELARVFGVVNPSGLREAAEAVAQHTDLVAIISKDSRGKVDGGILLRATPVKERVSPKDVVDYAVNNKRQVAENLLRATEHHSEPPSVRHAADAIDVKAVAAAVRDSLLQTLPPVLLKTLAAGGNAGLQLLATKLRAAEFDESKHPRDKDGKFTDGTSQPDEPGRYGYHVTITRSVPSIQKKGITQFNPSNWVKGSPEGERYGGGEIFAFATEGDALAWAAKTDWAKHSGFGTGKVSVVKFDAHGFEGWERDTADPISQAGAAGPWYKKMGSVPASDIVAHIPVTKEHVDQLRGSGGDRSKLKLHGLAEFDESKHPRDEKGQFTTGWHLTSDPNFTPDPSFKPEWNSLSGDLAGDMRPAGLFVGNPEYWMHAHGYERPYVAEIEGTVTNPPGSIMLPSQEKFMQGPMRTVRVLPLDEYAREVYRDKGWVEDFFGEGPKSIPKDYVGRPVSEMSPEEIKDWERKFKEYAERPDGPHPQGRDLAEFDESKHPRDDKGRWTSEGGFLSKDGERVTAFHGTADPDLTVADLDPAAAIEVGGATFFTTDADTAWQYTHQREYGEIVGDSSENVIKAQFRMKNPMVVDMEGDLGEAVKLGQLVDEAKAKGHDGLILENIDDTVDSSGGRHSNHTTIAVFHKDQIVPGEGQLNLLAEYDEEKHPRDDRGRWTDGTASAREPFSLAPDGRIAWQTDANGKVSALGISEDRWSDWTWGSDNINDLLAGTATGTMFDVSGTQMSEQDRADLLKTGQLIQAAAETHAVAGELWRGESAATLEEAVNRYHRNETVTLDRLTAAAVDPSIAAMYATVEPTGQEQVVPILLRIQRSGGTLGVQTIPETGVFSAEVVMPKGESFKVSGVYPPGHKIYNDSVREQMGIPKNAVVVQLYNKTPAPPSVHRYNPWQPMRTAGDYEGHPFHGNQWTSGGTKEDFLSVGSAQRGEPENAMIRAQMALGGGVMSVAIEHTGDLTHRMADPNTWRSAGYEHVKEKVDKLDRLLNHAYGFGREHDENIKHNAEYRKQDVAEFRAKVDSLLGAYADAHEKIPVFNEAQRVARDTAVALGRQDFKRVREGLKELKSHLGSAEEWVTYAHQGLRTASLRALEPPKKIGAFALEFDVNNPNAIAWAKEHAAELAQDLSDTTLDAIRQAIADAMESEDLRSSYDDILDAVGDETRADLIARTETMMAANEGQRQSWSQAVDDGLLTGDEQREWIATDGACDECEALDGAQTDLDGEYPNDGGDGPPLHPNCRCTEGISAR